jgi:hypothetical protein
MKTLKYIVLWIWVAVYTVFSMVGCAVEEVTTTTTSKSGLVTVEKRITKKADPAAWALAGAVVEGYAPRARIVRQEKSDTDMRKLLRGWKGGTAAALEAPITPEEIANRWKP